MSYYGYVQREADSFVNWAEAAKGMTDMLSEQNKIREEKKKAIDDNSRELSKFLSDNPVGNLKTASDASMKVAGQSQEYLLTLNKMLKSGQLKVNDYLSRVQNLKDDVTNFYETAKGYQARHKEVMDGINSGELSAFQADTFAELEGFGNWENLYTEINPATGQLWVGKMEQQVDENGNKIYVPPKGPSFGFQPSLNLKRAVTTNYMKFKMDNEVKNLVSSFGPQIRVIEAQAASVKRPGLLKEIADPMNREEALKKLPESLRKSIKSMEDAEYKKIDAVLTDNYKVLSILRDYATTEDGGTYGKTLDPKEAAADPTKILCRVENGMLVPDFSTPNGRKQYQVARDAVLLNMRMAYPYDEKAQPLTQWSDRSGGGGSTRSTKKTSTEEGPEAPEGTDEGAMDPASVTAEDFDRTAMENNIKNSLINGVAINAAVKTEKNLTSALKPYGITVETEDSIFGSPRAILTKGDKVLEFGLSKDADVPYDDIVNFVVENALPIIRRKNFPKAQPKKETKAPAKKPTTASIFDPNKQVEPGQEGFLNA